MRTPKQVMITTLSLMFSIFILTIIIFTNYKEVQAITINTNSIVNKVLYEKEKKEEHENKIFKENNISPYEELLGEEDTNKKDSQNKQKTNLTNTEKIQIRVAATSKATAVKFLPITFAMSILLYFIGYIHDDLKALKKTSLTLFILSSAGLILMIFAVDVVAKIIANLNKVF